MRLSPGVVYFIDKVAVFKCFIVFYIATMIYNSLTLFNKKFLILNMFVL